MPRPVPTVADPMVSIRNVHTLTAVGRTICRFSSLCPCSAKHLFPLITDHRFLSPPDNIWRLVYLWWVNKRPLQWTRGPVGKRSHEPCSETLLVCPLCSGLSSGFHSMVYWCSDTYLGLQYQSLLFFKPGLSVSWVLLKRGHIWHIILTCVPQYLPVMIPPRHMVDINWWGLLSYHWSPLAQGPFHITILHIQVLTAGQAVIDVKEQTAHQRLIDRLCASPTKAAEHVTTATFSRASETNKNAL